MPSWLAAVNGHLQSGRINMKTLLESKQALNVACWNVRTMLDNADSSCPERRSALVAHELSRLNIDITALSEVRLAD